MPSCTQLGTALHLLCKRASSATAWLAELHFPLHQRWRYN
jgi:hypothetical protein